MRKNLLLIVLGCVLIYMPARAQLQKGTGYFGATIGLTGMNNNVEIVSGSNIKQNDHLILPSLSAGKFVKDNMLLGIQAGTRLSLRSLKTDNPAYAQAYKNHDNAYFISPFVRNYKAIGSKSKWAIFLTSSADIALHRSKWKADGQSEQKEKGFSAGIGTRPGIAYWISPRFALESDINLLSVEAGYRKRGESNSFYFRSGVTSNHNGYFSVRASWYIQKP